MIVLAGPTAVGKSDFAIEIAKKIEGEVISADSMQVYRGMDIGTAKVDPVVRLEVPHHLLDIRNPSEPFNVVDFYYEARHACQEILNRGSVPIITGGSGFYLHAFIYGPPSGPPSIPEVREKLEKEWEKWGAEFLFSRLKKIDPAYAKTITLHDRHKVIRGLEIIELTGKPVSYLPWSERRRPQNYDFRCWFLHRPRESLYQRINARCDAMLEAGFLQEVEELLEKNIEENPSAAQAIGYRHAIAYLRSEQGPEAHAAFVREFKRSSRQYVKKQLTWFRNKKEAIFQWLDLDLHDNEVAQEMVINDYFETR